MTSLGWNHEGARGSVRWIGLRQLWQPAAVLLAAMTMTGLLAGCGSDGDGGGGGFASCTVGEQTPIGNLMVCEEASGLTAASANQFQQSCMAPATPADAGVTVGATFAHTPCSHDGALGGCRIQMGGMTVTVWYYASGPTDTFTSSDIQSLCSSAGATFVSP